MPDERRRTRAGASGVGRGAARTFVRSKLLRLVVVVIVVTFFSFWLIKLLPGDPVNDDHPVRHASASKAQLTKDLGLDKPFFEQYCDWLGNFFTGDFGHSYYAPTRRCAS